MEHATFIVGSWVLTLASIALYARWIVARGKDMARDTAPEELPWT